MEGTDTLIAWTDELLTGNAIIDDDHKQLVELINAICVASTTKKVAPPGVPGKRADLLYVVIFCRLVLRDDYLVSRLA